MALGFFVATGKHGEISKRSKLDLSFDPRFLVAFKNASHEGQLYEMLCFKHLLSPPLNFWGG